MANFLELLAENKKLKEDSKKHTDELASVNAKSTKNTIKNIKDNHNVHLECYMLGLFLKEITDSLSESDDHEAYKRWLTNNKEYIGLKKQTRKSGVGSTNVSVALGDLSIDEVSIDEDEDEGAGAGAGED